VPGVAPGKVLIIGGGKLVALTSELNQTSAALGIRMSWIYSIIPISGVLWVLYGLYYIQDIARHGRMRLPSEINGDPDPTRIDPIATQIEAR
jgi:TRAP-type C4-dicarboxylate transport system permease small subunit